MKFICTVCKKEIITSSVSGEDFITVEENDELSGYVCKLCQEEGYGRV